MRRKEGNDQTLLRSLQFSRSILRAVHFLRSRPALGGAEWDGMERGDKKRKGKHKMKNEISSALFDMYDIRKALSKGIKNKPKDSESTETSIGDCIDSVIETLERLEEVTP